MESSFNQDVLLELGNIGSNHAATALSQMVGETVLVKVAEIKILDLSELVDAFGGPETFVLAVYMKLFGDVEGECFIVYTKNSGLLLADKLLGNEPGVSTTVDELAVSAVTEASQILTGSYLSGFSSLLGLSIIHGKPHFVQDMIGAITDFITVRTAERAEKVILINATMQTELWKDVPLSATFVFLFPQKSIDIILEAVSKKYGV